MTTSSGFDHAAGVIVAQFFKVPRRAHLNLER